MDSVVIGIQEAAQEVTVPPTRSERVELLSEMIRMMASDGELAESEKRICATVSAAMDFTSQEFNDILDQLLEG